MASHRPLTTAAGLLVALLASACNTAPTPGIDRGEALFGTCVPCHGPDGGGNPELAAPAIAGMQRWYIEAQLNKFQVYDRGYHPSDLPGLRMRPMAKSLELEGDVASVSEYVASMPAVAVPVTVQGDVAAGKTTYAVCAACHQADGKGNKDLNAPALVGMSDWYLVTQLQNFKSGARGKGATDATGSQMAPMAAGLDDAAMANVVSYIQTLNQGGGQ